MNWIKTNTFLAGLIGVLIVGIGVFGYLIFSGNQRLKEAREEVDSAKTSYQRLSRLDEVPVDSVLENKQKTVEKLESETQKLHEQMVERYGSWSDGGDAATFGQRVEARFNELRTMWEEAEGTKMEVPDRFFLGFEKYRTSIQAQPSAVAELDSQLAGLSWLVEQAVKGGIDEIGRFDREFVEGEDGPSSSSADKDSEDVRSPYNSYSLIATFRGNEDEIRSLLNTIVSSDDHFFGIRYVKLRNSKSVAPTRSSVEGQVDKAKPAAEPTDTNFFFPEEEEAESFEEDANPFAGMSDAQRRAAQAAGNIEDEEDEADNDEEGGDDLTSNAGIKADFTEEPGRQDAVVFLGQEDVTLTVVLDYVIFAPVAEESESAE